MSVADEILRIQQAKSDLATSITNKGVTVPAATTLDGYAALVDSISGGDVNIFDEIRDNVYIATPYSSPFNASYAATVSIKPGKTYKVILKCRNVIPALSLNLYEGNANTPRTYILGLSNEMIKETTYTHNAETTYTRMGLYAADTSVRNQNYSCAIYIKEIE